MRLHHQPVIASLASLALIASLLLAICGLCALVTANAHGDESPKTPARKPTNAVVAGSDFLPGVSTCRNGSCSKARVVKRWRRR